MHRPTDPLFSLKVIPLKMMYYPDFFSLRTADVSPRSSPLRTVLRGGTFLLAKSPSAEMSDEKRLPFAG